MAKIPSNKVGPEEYYSQTEAKQPDKLHLEHHLMTDLTSKNKLEGKRFKRISSKAFLGVGTLLYKIVRFATSFLQVIPAFGRQVWRVNLKLDQAWGSKTPRAVREQAVAQTVHDMNEQALSHENYLEQLKTFPEDWDQGLTTDSEKAKAALKNLKGFAAAVALQTIGWLETPPFDVTFMQLQEALFAEKDTVVANVQHAIGSVPEIQNFNPPIQINEETVIALLTQSIKVSDSKGVAANWLVPTKEQLTSHTQSWQDWGKWDGYDFNPSSESIDVIPTMQTNGRVVLEENYLKIAKDIKWEKKGSPLLQFMQVGPARLALEAKVKEEVTFEQAKREIYGATGESYGHYFDRTATTYARAYLFYQANRDGTKRETIESLETFYHDNQDRINEALIGQFEIQGIYKPTDEEIKQMLFGGEIYE